MEVRPAVSPEDRAWCQDLWRQEWGGEAMVTRGKEHCFQDLQAIIAWSGETRVGLATYLVEGEEGELMSLNATVEGQGAGTALLTAVEAAAAAAGCRRLSALYPDAVDEARRLKPTIPLVGNHGIPLHDELELEKVP